MTPRVYSAVAAGCGPIPLFHGLGIISLVLYFMTKESILLVLMFGELILVPFFTAVTAFLFNIRLSQDKCMQSVERAWKWNIVTSLHSLSIFIMDDPLCHVQRRLGLAVSKETVYFKHAFFVAARSVPYCHACALGLLVYFHRYPDGYSKYCSYAGVFFLILPLIVGGVTYCFIDHHSWEFEHGEDHLDTVVFDIVRFNAVTIIPTTVFIMYSFFVIWIRDALASFIHDFPPRKVE